MINIFSLSSSDKHHFFLRKGLNDIDPNKDEYYKSTNNIKCVPF